MKKTKCLNPFVMSLSGATLMGFIVAMLTTPSFSWAADVYIHTYGAPYEDKADAEKWAITPGMYEIKKICPKGSDPKVLEVDIADCKQGKVRWVCRKKAWYVCNSVDAKGYVSQKK